jgi:hypothetical protein
LFAESPFVSKNHNGVLILDPNHGLQVQYDAKSQRIFAGQNGEWAVTSLTDNEWHRLNHSPQ